MTITPEIATERPRARRINDACRAIGISRTSLYTLAAKGKSGLSESLAELSFPSRKSTA
jgi:hypothetical protein